MESLDFVSSYAKRRSLPDVSLNFHAGQHFGSSSGAGHVGKKLPVVEDEETAGRWMERGKKGRTRTMSPVGRQSQDATRRRGQSLLQRLELGDAAETRHKFLGDSGLKVSNVCLSGLSFGTFPGSPARNTNEAVSRGLLDTFVEMGGNFIDTADTYPGMGSHAGLSESIIGRWLSGRDRHRIVVGTKCRYVTDPGSPNGVGLSRNHILRSLDQSLKRLQTDYVDLYQIHGWDAGTPVERVLRTLDDAVRAGKVRYIGAANLAAWQLQKFCSYAQFMGLEKLVTAQMNYSLLARGIENDVVEVCREEKVGILSWSPLRNGLLRRKASRPTDVGADDVFEPKKSGEFKGNENEKDRYNRVVDVAEHVAKTNDKTMAQVSLRWLIQKPHVTSVVLSASTTEEVTEAMGAASGWALADDEVALLDAASKPEVEYPNSMAHQAGRMRRGLEVE